MAAELTASPPTPTGLLVELTHRCPLGCPYCSNPLTLEKREDEIDAVTWARVFKEAAALGVLHVHLSGGEPGVRRDIVDIVAHAREAGLRTHLITSGVGITARTLRDLWEAGLDQIEVSFQDADAVSSDRIAGQRGAFQRKHALAAEAARLGLRLTVNVVVHRANIERIAAMVDLAIGLTATRITINHARYIGWAVKNRGALMPTAAQVERAMAELDALRRKHAGRIVVDIDCGKDRLLSVAPSGRVQFDGGLALNVRDHPLAELWARLPTAEPSAGAAGWPIAGTLYSRQQADLPLPQDEKPYKYRRM